MTSTAVRQIPILFSSPMVRAIQDNRKSQTRRVVKAQNELEWLGAAGDDRSDARMWGWRVDGNGSDEYVTLARDDDFDSCARCPYGAVGDVLWVRENWRAGEEWDDQKPSEIGPAAFDGRADIYYEADGILKTPKELGWGKLRSGRFMVKWMYRLELEVTDVRVERLNSISEADAIAEGLLEWTDPPRVPTKHYGAGIPDVWETDPRRAYARLWDTINGKTYSWKSSPWVWAIAFKKLDGRPS